MSDKKLPSAATPENIALLLQLLSEGYSVEKAGKSANIKVGDIWRVLEFDENIRRRFHEHRRKGLEKLADTLLDIPDDYEEIARGKLKSDNIKWLLSKRLPSEYGDRVQVDVNHTVDITGALDEAKKRVLPKSYQELPASKETLDIPATKAIEKSSKGDENEDEPMEIDIFL